MVIFGGKDDSNNKLNDLWKFNFKTHQWTEIKYQGAEDQEISPRSGHTACVY